MSEAAWTNLSGRSNHNSILQEVRARLKQIRSTIRQGVTESRDRTDEAWADADFGLLTSLLGIESLHPNKKRSRAKSVVKAYERAYERVQQERAAAAEEEAEEAAAEEAAAEAAAMIETPTTQPSENTNASNAATSSSSSSLCCDTCSLTFNNGPAYGRHKHKCLGGAATECPVCFGHRGATLTFLTNHADECTGLPADQCFFVCDKCRTNTNHNHHIFQLQSLKDKIKHLKKYHLNETVTQQILHAKRHTCNCGRQLLGKDFIQHQCRGAPPKKTGRLYYCDCKYVLPKEKKKHLWKSIKERRTHVDSGSCYKLSQQNTQKKKRRKK